MVGWSKHLSYIHRSDGFCLKTIDDLVYRSRRARSPPQGTMDVGFRPGHVVLLFFACPDAEFGRRTRTKELVAADDRTATNDIVQ